MHHRSLLRAAGASLLTSALLAGCGSGGGAGSPMPAAEKAVPVDTIALAADKLVEARTARTAVVVKEGANGASVTGQGVYDARTGRTSLAVVDAAGDKGRIVFDGTTVYVKVPPDQAAELPGGKPWLEIDVAAVARAADPRFQNVVKATNIDPAQGLAYLKGVTGDVRRVGTETLRGVASTRYRAIVDLRAALARQTATARLHITQALGQVESGSFPIDAWIDGQGRLRKLHYELTLRGKRDKDAASRSSTIEFFDFGAAAVIQRPPSGQVSNFLELLGRLQRELRERQGRDGPS